MAIIVNGTKVVPVPGDTLIIKDSADANALKEIDFANLGVGNIVLTDTTLLVKTYTMYSDAGTANLIGTITVSDGVAGTGLSVPDYDNGKDYDQNEVVMEAGIFYRATTIGVNVGNLPSLSAANWDFIPIGGAATNHDPDVDYAIGDVVIRAGVFFTPIEAIAGATLAVPFVEGTAADEWRNIAIVPVYRAPIQTQYTANGTHTFDAACVRAEIQIQGAGAGGGSLAALATQRVILPAGGAGANLLAHLTATSLVGTMAVVVGLANTTTTTALNNTQPGGDSTVVVLGNTIIAGGAPGGSVIVGAGDINAPGSLPGVTTTPATADVAYFISGISGRGGFGVLNGTQMLAGDGGDCPLGEGGQGTMQRASNYFGPVTPGIGFGFGACGQCQPYSATDFGSNNFGGHGIVVVTEYFS